jgi:hypothetical protein
LLFFFNLAKLGNKFASLENQRVETVEGSEERG